MQYVPLNIATGIDYRNTDLTKNPLRDGFGVGLKSDFLAPDARWTRMVLAPAGETIIHMDQYTPTSLDFQLLAVTDRAIYVRQGNRLTKLADYYGSSKRVVSSTMWLDWWLVTDRTNPIKKWNGASLTNLGGNPPLARCITVHNQYCLLGFTEEQGYTNPQRVQWSDTAGPETWNSGNAGFVDLVDTPDWIQGFVELAGDLYVFKERSIYLFAYTGYPVIWNPVSRVKGVGLLAPKSIENLGDEVIFLGSDNVYTFDGRVLTSIGGPIWEALFSGQAKHGREALSNARGVYVEELEEYWLCIEDRIYAYHFPTKTWWIRRAPDSVTSVSVWQSEYSDQWDNTAPAWNEVDPNFMWDAAAMKPTSYITVVSTADGIYYTDYGFVGDYDGELVIGGVTPEGRIRVRSLLIECKGVGGALAVKESRNGMLSWQTVGSREVDALKWTWIRFPLLKQITEDVFYKLEFSKVNIRRVGFEVVKAYTRPEVR